MKTKKILLSFLILLPIHHFSFADENAPDLLSQEFKKALQNHKQTLSLSSTEADVFEHEILPASKYFIETYSESSGSEGYAVSINEEAVRSYLKLKSSQRLCIVTRPVNQNTCTYCKDVAAQLKNSFSNLFRKRGFMEAPVDSAIGEGELTGQMAFEEVLSKLSTTGCQSVVYSEVSSPRAEVFKAKLFIQTLVKDQNENRRMKFENEIVFENTKEAVQKNGPFYVGLLAPVFKDWQKLLNQKNVNMETSERLLTLTGIKNYLQFQAVKNWITAKLPDLRIEERLIESGQVSFAVYSQKTNREIASDLKRDQTSEPSIDLVESGEDQIRVKLK